MSTNKENCGCSGYSLSREEVQKNDDLLDLPIGQIIDSPGVVLRVGIREAGPKGKDGKDGKSAYDLWLEQGNEGSLNDFLGEKIVSDGSGVSGDKFEMYEQLSPMREWTIKHKLNKYPSVTIVDSGGSIVVGAIKYIDKNNLTVSFTSEFSGKAYLN